MFIFQKWKKNAANLNFLNYHVLEYMQMQIIALPCYLQKMYGLVDQMVKQKKRNHIILYICKCWKKWIPTTLITINAFESES